MTRRYQRKQAFTLIEMMIIFCVIAALAVMAIPHILRSKITANQVNAKATLKAVGVALEAYLTDHSLYPSGVSHLMGDKYPYLNKNYFEGEHCGYTFSAEIDDSSYTVTATPVSVYTGTKILTMTTGIVFSEAAAEFE
ncbi:MAG TPA: hypothetical protein VLJ10_00835 [Candidatus Bathyarchaeia archaeon]|nr:hypothetical protein [Candidatus Bathyarchaeia archaeon]